MSCGALMPYRYGTQFLLYYNTIITIIIHTHSGGQAAGRPAGTARRDRFSMLNLRWPISSIHKAFLTSAPESGRCSGSTQISILLISLHNKLDTFCLHTYIPQPFLFIGRRPLGESWNQFSSYLAWCLLGGFLQLKCQRGGLKWISLTA